MCIFSSATYFIFLQLVDPYIFYSPSIFPFRLWLSNICKLCTVECIIDCEEEDYRYSIWADSNVRKCSAMFFPIDSRGVGGWRIVKWIRLFECVDIFYIGGYIWGDKFFGSVSIFKIGEGKAGWRKDEKIEEIKE